MINHAHQHSEGIPKLGDPGVLCGEVYERTITSKEVWVHPKGIAGTSVPLEKPIAERSYSLTGRPFGKEYTDPSTVGETVSGGLTIAELARHAAQFMKSHPSPLAEHAGAHDYLFMLSHDAAPHQMNHRSFTKAEADEFMACLAEEKHRLQEAPAERVARRVSEWSGKSWKKVRRILGGNKR